MRKTKIINKATIVYSIKLRTDMMNQGRILPFQDIHEFRNLTDLINWLIREFPMCKFLIEQAYSWLMVKVYSMHENLISDEEEKLGVS